MWYTSLLFECNSIMFINYLKKYKLLELNVFAHEYKHYMNRSFILGLMFYIINFRWTIDGNFPSLMTINKL